MKGNITTAIILAGGLGTRLREEVPDLPKPMAPILGRPFLEHQLDYWIDQEVGRFILSVGYMKEVIIDYFGNNYRGIPIEYAIEKKPLGTGGGMLLAAQRVSSPFIVLNGDTFIEVNLSKLFEFHNKYNSEWTFSLFRADQPNRYMGMDVNDNGEIQSLKSKIGETGCLANGGVYLINPSVVEKLNYRKDEKISLEDELVTDFMSSGGTLYGMECCGKFIDIGIPEDYRRAETILPEKN